MADFNEQLSGILCNSSELHGPLQLTPEEEVLFHKDSAQFIAKDSDPNGVRQHEPGAKLDNGKPRAGLVLRDFGNALLEVSEVGTFGAEKYTPHGWLSVKNGEERYLDAAMRHLLIKGSDSESGIDHLAHAAWNILAVLELRYHKLAIDERLKRDESVVAYPNEGQRVAEEE